MHKILLGANMLVRIAGENLAASAREPVSERCEQCALGLIGSSDRPQSNAEILLFLLFKILPGPDKSLQSSGKGTWEFQAFLPVLWSDQ
jgi:hypothetical protein